jgi:mono/diheme cytochrome c family protein
MQAGNSLLISLLIVLLTGCAQEMSNQRRVESQEATEAYPDGAASRSLPQHAILADSMAMESVSAGQIPLKEVSFNAALANNEGGYRDGKSDGEMVSEVPPAVLKHYDYRQLLERGRQRFNISCAPCHDRTGSGNGMVARRGFKYPPSYHTDRLRQKPLGYIFGVATHGRGQMPSYGDFISTDDRWAIAAYVRTLQYSQYAVAGDLSEADRAQLAPVDAANTGSGP